MLICVYTDIEDVSRELIEDNIVAVSQQMIDKEASVARVTNSKASENGAHMEVDEEL
jgi:26S proteasome regulatory subunit N11